MNDLETLIAEKIESSGPISFCEFMRLALYHPDFGYYNSQVRIGKRDGDFYTNADVHNLFGAVLADAIVKYLDQIPSDKPKSIVEFGAGTGKLALDILLTLQEDYSEIASAIEYVIVEQSDRLKQRQQETLTGFSQVKWSTDEELMRAPISGVVLSNELIDAFPIHIVRFHEGELQEEFVTVAQDRFVSEWQSPSTEALAQYIDQQQITLQPNQIIEINLEAIRWMKDVSSIVSEGAVVTIDYGDVANRLYSADRPNGTLRCFSSHNLTDDPFVSIGKQDITSSVNFTALFDEGNRIGLTMEVFDRQAEWLIRNNIIQRAERFEHSLQAAEDTIAIMKCRHAVKDLLLPGGISDNFKVLIQRRVQQAASLLKT